VNSLDLTRRELEGCIQEYIRKDALWKPDILLVKKDAHLAVVKDYAYQPFLYRFFVGIFANHREMKIYEKLKGVRGVPKIYGRIDRYAMVLSYIDGRNTDKCVPGELDDSFFKKLREIVDEIHDRGIVLCDLRNARNIMVGEHGEPYLIDLCTAFCRGGRFNFIRNFAHDIFYQDDLLGIAKLKSNLAPHLLTEEEREKLRRGLTFQRQAIWIRNVGRKVLKKIGRIGGSNGRNRKSSS
jgi:tRNA A-37 threonylcarbamoyl transferase component Bud32